MDMKRKDTIIMGAALFAMFFGAGNLIFPPYIGLNAGEDWMWSLLGFVMTGIGLPVMGVIAVAKTGGNINNLAGRVSPVFAKVFGSIAVLAIGPLLAIPRTGATVYEIGIQPLFGSVNPWIISIIYFSVTLFFVLKPSAIVDIIGKFLTPILLLVISFIIVKGIMMPVGAPVSGVLEMPFSKGFTEGYQTMDAFVAIAMAGIILISLLEKGYSDPKEQIGITVRSGLIAGLGLLTIYGGLLYLGATSSGLFPTDIAKSDLIVNITNLILGHYGQIAMCVVVSAACLTTAIGITAIVGNYFSELSNNRFEYKSIVVATAIFSCIMSVSGIESIIKLAVPLLTLVYPVAIILILMGMVDEYIKNKNIYKYAVIGALSVSVFEALAVLNIEFAPIQAIISKLPLASAGFGWLLPAVGLSVIGNLLTKRRAMPEPMEPVENM